MSTKILNGIVVVFMLLAPNSVLANRFTDQVQTQLARIAVVLGLGDDYELADVYVDSVRRGNNDTLTLTLFSGKTYAIVGVCDEDCRDIDLRIYDDNDNLVVSDMESDDKPMVRISPRWTAKFRIEVLMQKCRTSTCYYGVGAFKKDRW